MNNILNLQGITKLENLIFKEKDGSNPICSYETYHSFINDNLTQVKMLDNHDIYNYARNNSNNNNNFENTYNTYNPNNIPMQNNSYANPWINNNNTTNNFKGQFNKNNNNPNSKLGKRNIKK